MDFVAGSTPTVTRTTDRIIGSVVGLAVGDALGAPVEGWSAERISTRFGTLQEYADTGRLPGAYTDDTQQALCVVDGLLEHGAFDPEVLGRKFIELAQPIPKVRGRYFGAFRGTGPGFRQAVRRLAKGASWKESGTVSAGNGSAMRVGPLGAFHHNRRFVTFREAAFQSAWITHRDPRALAAAFAIAYSVIYAINQGDSFHPERYLRELAATVRDAESVIEKHYWTPDLGLDRGVCHHVSGAIRRLRPRLTRRIGEVLEDITGYAQGCTDLPAHARSAFVVGSGTVAVYLFARHFEHLQDALVTAINLGGDTDTIGAMVGTLCGALHGYSAIPEGWRRGLRNHDAIHARATALARGSGMPEGVPGLREMEVALTVEEALR